MTTIIKSLKQAQDVLNKAGFTTFLEVGEDGQLSEVSVIVEGFYHVVIDSSYLDDVVNPPCYEGLIRVATKFKHKRISDLKSARNNKTLTIEDEF